MMNQLSDMVQSAQTDLTGHVEPRNDFERAVINALGEISWNEAIAAIERHRAGQC